ncbi:MAG TPA: ABC transporter permease [Chitinophagales bacterium]
MNTKENIRLALRSIRGNILRTSLTLVIIAIGISALISIITATEGITRKLSASFSEMGANTFSIKNDGTVRKKRRRGAQVSGNPYITYQDASAFKKQYKYPSVVSVSALADGATVVRHANKKTNPNVTLFGVDENYLQVSGYNIVEGRNFSKQEIDNGQNVAIIGKDVVKKLFENNDSVLLQSIHIGNARYTVVGILASKGASQVSSDNQIMIPVLTAKYNIGNQKTSYIINIMIKDALQMEAAIEESNGLMRAIRRVALGNENDFEIIKSDRLANQVLDQLSYVRYATLVIGFLTLIGAGIGLMNIMLVSVNERTREIGICKAIGANKRNILTQFLTESVTICMIGGAIGVLIGLLLGNLVGIALQSGFIMPWLWMLLGMFSTFIIGLAAGIYPAYKASNLDPVEALRYE